MNYWLNVHHPREISGESFQNQCKIYIQEKTQHYKDKIKNGDVCFIYETACPGRIIYFQKVGGNRERVNFRRGAKGVIATVKIVGEFESGEWYWDEDKYIGMFETEIIEINEISSSTINDAYRRAGIKAQFVPLVNGGIKPVELRKARIIEKLMQHDG